jgi:hypothetical protein
VVVGARIAVTSMNILWYHKYIIIYEHMPLKDKTKRKEYHNKYMREVWYPNNRKRHIGYVKNLKEKLSKFIEEYKRDRKCIDCGYLGNICPQVLEFDHVRG